MLFGFEILYMLLVCRSKTKIVLKINGAVDTLKFSR